jgi:hypothetical protein
MLYLKERKEAKVKGQLGLLLCCARHLQDNNLQAYKVGIASKAITQDTEQKWQNMQILRQRDNWIIDQGSIQGSKVNSLTVGNGDPLCIPKLERELLPSRATNLTIKHYSPTKMSAVNLLCSN